MLSVSSVVNLIQALHHREHRGHRAFDNNDGHVRKRLPFATFAIIVARTLSPASVFSVSSVMNLPRSLTTEDTKSTEGASLSECLPALPISVNSVLSVVNPSQDLTTEDTGNTENSDVRFLAVPLFGPLWSLW